MRALLYGFIISCQLIYLLSLYPWSLFVMMSAMLFDAPGSTQHVFTWAVFFAVLLFPLFILFCAVLAWRLLKRKKWLLAVLINTAPLIPIAIIAFLLLRLNMMD